MITNSLHKAITALKSLPKTPSMPVLFVGHGNPMNAIEDNEFSASWRELGKTLPKPKAIIVMSAHWVTGNGSYVTALPKPEIIYDFYGFPPELYAAKYPVVGSPELAKEICAAPPFLLDVEWGIDHGAWSVLKQMYPSSDIPVLQLSVNFGIDPEQELEQTKLLSELRNHGVLFMGSGNIVHNLQLIKWEGGVYDWSLEFDSIAEKLVSKRDLKKLANHRNLGEAARLSIPTDEHYRPMLNALALAGEKDVLKFFNEKVIMGSLGMRSFVLQE